MFPDDPCELATIVLDATQGPERREQGLTLLIEASRAPGAPGRAACNQLARLMSQLPEQAMLTRIEGELAPLIRRLARQVCGGRSCAPHLAQELQEDAVSHVLFPRRIRQFNPQGSGFHAWCRTVLVNRLRDLVRRRAPSAATGTAAEEGEIDPPAAESAIPLRSALDFTLPFSEADLARIEGWVPVNRVLLLCMAGLWRKVSAERWQTWVTQASLDNPFPPAELIDHEDPTERVAFLAAVLGVRPNTMSARWSRYRHLLGQLAFLQELHEP